MSMRGYYIRIEPKAYERFVNRPSSLADFLDKSLLTENDDPRHLCLDKAWQAIHFLLNGNGGCGITPLSDAVMGGTPLGDDEYGYGPPRGLTAHEVRMVATALTRIPAAKIYARYNAAALLEAEIYPNSWEETEADRTYVSKHYAKLVEFFQAASAGRDAMILFIT